MNYILIPEGKCLFYLEVIGMRKTGVSCHF